MRYSIWTIAMLVPLTLAAKEHKQDALTVDQCRASVRVYGDEVHDLSKLPFSVLELKRNEMFNCFQSDSAANHDQRQEYLDVMGKYSNQQNVRAYNFLVRHHLLQQLIEEDDKGIR